MKAISHGNNTYDIFDDSLQVYNKLPAQVYVVRYNENHGFFLSKYMDMEIRETKVYGVHESKVNKVLASFAEMNRNLGVILSGDKGIGKSLFAKMLASKSIQIGIPVIVVDTFVNGLASYIESIDQEIMVLFDEFDKTFGEVKSRDGDASPQTGLLTLFDGLSGGKKLFVITCNELRKLNDYLINRPGRFHYHFRFEYPTASEIREYLYDKLDEKYYKEVENVVSFSGKVSLNYDSLRSIAFELNHGLTFSEAIMDLNILNINSEVYNITLKYANGMVVTCRNECIDMFCDDGRHKVYLNDSQGDNVVNAEFSPLDAMFDTSRCVYIITPDKLKLEYDDYYPEFMSAAKETGVECLIISRRAEKNIHFIV